MKEKEARAKFRQVCVSVCLCVCSPVALQHHLYSGVFIRSSKCRVNAVGMWEEYEVRVCVCVCVCVRVIAMECVGQVVDRCVRVLASILAVFSGNVSVT